jgi:hypothetical protein
MNRRRFIGGLGAVLGGGGALIGTGAFSSVEADRDVTVQVAQEDQAYLSLIASSSANGAFSSNQSSAGNQLMLDFDDAIMSYQDSGEGVGKSSQYEFDDVFRVRNRGTQTIYVNLDDVSTHGGDTTVQFYVRDGSGNRQSISSTGGSPLEVQVGTQESVGVYIETTDPTTGDSGGTVTVEASADVGSGSPPITT